MKKWCTYGQQILKTPIHITYRKGYRKLSTTLRHRFGKFRSRWIDTKITDVEFLRALHPPLKTIDAFLDCIKNRKLPNFFIESNRRSEFIQFFRTVAPNSEQQIINAANQVCDHIFDLLGSVPTHLGIQIDWHLDFKSGHRWNPQSYYADIKPAPYPGGYDIKIPWELNRCQHFAWLGQAYWFTNDEKYAHEFVAQVTDWVTQNPPNFGVNWACAMDVAIRAVNWLWGYYYFQGSPMLSNEFLITFFKNLLIHGRHIFDNLEFTEEITSNHYLSDIVGLIYLGILLPECKEAQTWRSFGLQELEKEMFKQVYSDGVDFEASTSYHRLVAELFLSATLLARLNNHTFSPEYMERLEKMLEFTMYITKPDGRVPIIGDCDNGRLHRLKVWDEPAREWSDHRYLLAIGAVLFQRTDFAQVAGDQWEEAIWFFGSHVETLLLSAKLSLSI